MNKTKRGSRVEQGSGNVFRDLGFPHPEREQVVATRSPSSSSGRFCGYFLASAR
jgi:hypothetical protein